MRREKPKLLIVDDGKGYAELAHAFLRQYDYATRCELSLPCWECPHRPGCDLTHAHDWAQTEQTLVRHPDVDVVLLDVTFDLGEERLLALPHDQEDIDRRRRLQGLAILRKLRDRHRSLPILLTTSREELGLDEEEEALLADEHLTLAGRDAFDARALSLLIERILARTALEPHERYEWGRSKAMSRIRHEAQSLAPTSVPMLVLGETGTGKTALVEEVIHRQSGRRGPFVSVDLSSIPRELVAAELFGSVKGAFSGAVDRQGRFEQADGGTLLLDEVGDLPSEAQRMLLLALQDRRVTRLGEGRPRAIDVKVVAATNRDLEAAVREGAFRADLLARLNPAARIRLPPLRERMEDLEPLLDRFVRRAFTHPNDRALLDAYIDALGLDESAPPRLLIGSNDIPERGVSFVLGEGSHRALRKHPFPGNVRELELLVANACLGAITDALAAHAHSEVTSGTERAIPIPARRIKELLASGWVNPAARNARRLSAPRNEAVDFEPKASLRELSRARERALFEDLFEETGGDFEAMARRLLLGDAAKNARKVRLRFNQLGLSVKDFR